MPLIRNPFIIVGSMEEGMKPYHIIQTIDGDECTLSITDYDSSVQTDNYLVDVYNLSDNEQKIYILDFYNGGA